MYSPYIGAVLRSFTAHSSISFVYIICSRLVNHILSAALLGLSLHVAANAQTSSTDGTTPQYLTPGAPAGSYSLSEVESVSLFNGNLNFSLPLLGIGGRGTAGYTMTLPIEQKWQVWKLAETPPGQAPILTPIGTWWGVKPGYSLA
jgi:hypothetical protein